MNKKINQIVNKHQKLNYIELKNTIGSSIAKIYLNLGGSLQELVLNKHHIIKDLSPLAYQNTYASSILFPFANRIADGIYNFDGKDYFLDINQAQENNALHGLVYNKTFKLVAKKTTKEEVAVLLRYEEKEYAQGFPYTYRIDLKYTLTNRSLDLSVSVKNTDSKTFLFTIGWHPYFNTSDLYNSIVRFNILFETPDYNFELISSEKDCFLQLYTPPKANTIAIEPTTGVSNSFNNKIGLKTLKPNDTYNINWKLKLN